MRSPVHRATAPYRIIQDDGGMRSRFNLCHKCGRWASDVMYNPNTLECVDCSP